VGVTVVTDVQLVEFADEVGDTDVVAVEGARTRWRVGGDLSPGARLVRAPSGVLDYQPEEMIVRVLAGTSVDELRAELKTRGQRTALARNAGTVGGALAVGENDVDVLGRGRIRDCVLQMKYVSAEGRIIKCGGPTVKNVSGFDVPRLMVGALGTLGFIAEVILRTNPIPAVSTWITSDEVDPFAVANVILKPSAVLWDGERTWVELEGHQLDVQAQEQDLRALGAWGACDGPPDLPTHRWSLRPADLRHLDRSEMGPYIASVGVGTVFATVAQPARSVAKPLADLSQRIKHEFDPTERLNPGRSPVGRYR
jgi:glycolate oxidase FAD binding subunit